MNVKAKNKPGGVGKLKEASGTSGNGSGIGNHFTGNLLIYCEAGLIPHNHEYLQRT